MARPRQTEADPQPQKTESIVTAVALVRAPGGGWVMRTYLVPADSTPHEDTDADTLGAAMGRATRELAKEAR